MRSAPRPRRVLTGICRAPDCEFPAGDRLGLCDRHINTFHAWRHHRVRVGDPDPSIEAYLENVTSRADGTAHVWLELPDRELLELELRFVIQVLHDDGKGLIAQARWRELVRELNALGVESLLDHDLDWWDAHRPAGFDRAPRWLCYLKRGWRALFAFRARSGLDDPWAHDVWYIDALPVDRAVASFPHARLAVGQPGVAAGAGQALGASQAAQRHLARARHRRAPRDRPVRRVLRAARLAARWCWVLVARAVRRVP